MVEYGGYDLGQYEEEDYPPTAKEIAANKANALRQKVRNASYGRFSNSPTAAGFSYAPGLFDQKTGEFIGDRAAAADRSGMQPASAIAKVEAAYTAGGGREREAQYKATEAAKGIYGSIEARDIAETSMREANARAAADQAKVQQTADLQSYTKLPDARGVFAKYASGMMDAETMTSQIAANVENRYGNFVGRNLGWSVAPTATTPGIRQTYESEIHRIVQQEIQRLQASPMFKDYEFARVGSQAYTPPAEPVPKAVSVSKVDSGGTDTMVQKGTSGTIIEQMFPGRDLSQKPLTAQESSALARARREGRAPSMNVADEGIGAPVSGVPGTYTPGYATDAQGNVTQAEKDKWAGQFTDPEGRIDPMNVPGWLTTSPDVARTPAVTPPVTTTQAPAPPSGWQPGNRYQDPETKNWYTLSDDGKTWTQDPETQQQPLGYFPTGGGNGRPGANIPQGTLVQRPWWEEQVQPLPGSPNIFNFYPGGQAPGGVAQALPGDKLKWIRNPETGLMEQVDPSTTRLLDPLRGYDPKDPSTWPTTGAGSGGKGGFIENLQMQYEEGFIGTGPEDFPELYKKAETYYRDLWEAKLSSGIEKQSIDNPKYRTQKLQMQTEALTLARHIRDTAAEKVKTAEQAGAAMKPALTFSTTDQAPKGPRPTMQPFVEGMTAEEYDAERVDYQTKLQAWETSGQQAGQFTGLGFDSDSIRSNLDNLPPDDDRRGALTELLTTFKKFETQVAMAETAQQAKQSLEELSQGFQARERMLRERLSSGERMEDQRIQKEITEWQQGQKDFADTLGENIRIAETTGVWPGGAETLEKSRLDFQKKQEASRQTFEQEMRTTQEYTAGQRATAEMYREQRMGTIEEQAAERQTAEIGREQRDWEGEQTRLNAVLTGYLETPDNQTLAAQEFGWAQILDKADRTGLFGPTNIETLAFKSQKFQEGLAETKQKNTVRLEEIKLEMNENDNETKIAIADKQVAIERGKLEDAVKSRRVQMKLEGDKLDFQKTQMRLQAMETLLNPKTLLVLQRTGMISTLERILGMSLNMPNFPELLPPGQTIPTQQYLNMASPGDRELIMTEASLRSGFSEMDVRSVLQRQTPGGLGVAIGYRGEGR